jgi:hypothetical protein
MRLAALTALLLVFGAYFASDSKAADTPATAPAPAVKIDGASPLTEQLTAMKGGAFTAQLNLDIENDSAASIPYHLGPNGGYEIELAYSRVYSGQVKAPTISPGNAAQSGAPALAPRAVTPVPATLTVYDSDTTSLTVVVLVTSPPGTDPVTLPGVASVTQQLTLTRTSRSSNLWAILAASLVMGAFVLVLSRHKLPEREEPDSVIYADAAFSFSQSWLTIITAALTAVGAVFSTSGVLTGLLPGINTSFFTECTIVYGVVLLLGPIAYCSLQTVGTDNHIYGTHRGYVLAAAITAVAAGGQLATVGAVVALSDLGGGLRAVFFLLLIIAAGVVIAYVEATRRQLWRLRKQDPAKTAPALAIAALAPGTTVTLAAGEPEPGDTDARSPGRDAAAGTGITAATARIAAMTARPSTGMAALP